MIKYTIDKSQAIIFEGRTLYRIKALRDFADVTKGDYGGYIQNYRNLSQNGTCWIYDDAKVLNDAEVFGSARINDKVTLSSHAKVYGNAMLNDNVTVTDYAKIYDDAYLNDRVHVRGFANIYGKAKLYNDVLITDSVHIFGKTKLEGSLYLTKDAIISSSNDVFGFNDVTQKRYLTYTVSNQTWVADTGVIGNHQDLLDSATTDKTKTIYQHYIAIIKNSEK